MELPETAWATGAHDKPVGCCSLAQCLEIGLPAPSAESTR